MIIKHNEAMNNHTTFRVGGPTDVFIATDNEVELIQVLRTTPGSILVIGNGSNLIVRDKGIRGTVLKFIGNHVTVKGLQIIAQAGISLRRLSKIALEHGLTGLEFVHDIPGTLGGAVYMNAGAWGGVMSQVVREVRAVNRYGEERIFTDFDFGYRKSCFQENKFIILEVVLELQSGVPEEIQQTLQLMSERRRMTQPLNFPSCGTVFKKGGKWIKRAGLAGLRIGGAEVSTKNPGFIINRRHASARDIEKLIQHIYRTVRKRTGKRLRLEAQVVGEK